MEGFARILLEDHGWGLGPEGAQYAGGARPPRWFFISARGQFRVKLDDAQEHGLP
jgi:hypothetical protein